MTGTVPYSLSGKRVWVAGHRGMVGSALVRRLERENCLLLTATRSELDLTDGHAVSQWVARNRPQAIFMAAARVGGIVANDSYPADFLWDNLAIETAIFHAAFEAGIEKMLFLGSSCIYPKLAPQPMTEEALLTGPLEETNQWYAVAKIAGIKLCQAFRRQHGCDYISAMPTNLYGAEDNFNLENSHVIPALLRKAHDAKMGKQPTLTIWGTGTPRREFLHVDDCADALVFLMKSYSGESHVNVGAGTDLTIAELAQAVARTVGYEGRLLYDAGRPDGPPRKLMSNARLVAMGWTPSIGLEDGLRRTYEWFLAQEQVRT